jgi:hypothetical protein
MNITGLAVELGAGVKQLMSEQIATVDKFFVAHWTPEIILHPARTPSIYSSQQALYKSLSEYTSTGIQYIKGNFFWDFFSASFNTASSATAQIPLCC